MPNTYETKLWGGRFRGDEDALMQHFNSECWRTSWLVEPDIQGSLAHVAMQVKCGLLSSAEGEALTRAWNPSWPISRPGSLFTPKNTRMCIPLWSCT